MTEWQAAQESLDAVLAKEPGKQKVQLPESETASTITPEDWADGLCQMVCVTCGTPQIADQSDRVLNLVICRGNVFESSSDSVRTV